MAISEIKTDISTPVENKPIKKRKWLPAWFRKWWEWNEFLRADVEFRKKELLELVDQGKKREEEMDMVKKLARVQVEEIAGLYKKVAELEMLYHDAKAERDLLKTGIIKQDGEVKAITLVKTQSKGKDQDELWAPVVFTISEDGTQILNRHAHPDSERKYALDNARIEFINLFDPELLH